MEVGKKSIKISIMKKATTGGLKDINHLLSQLRRNRSVATGTMTDLKAILGNKYVVMLAALDGTKVVGVATLYILQKVAKRVARVEDVVVDVGYRGQGLGKRLMQELIAVARERGVKELELTSGADRVEANALYVKLGFKPKETNAYTRSL